MRTDRDKMDSIDDPINDGNIAKVLVAAVEPVSRIRETAD